MDVQLGTLKNTLQGVDSSTCNLQDTVDSISSSSKSEKSKIDDLKKLNNKVDIILSHICPYKYLPREMFLASIDQSTVDYSTEYFLDQIEESTNYILWYCNK